MSRSASGAVIGGAAALHQFVRIGRGAMVGGVSGVEADVIPFGSVIGNRARLAGLNVIGLQPPRRRTAPAARAARARCGPCSGGRACSPTGSRRCGARTATDALVAEVLDFVDAPSKRGLIRAAIGAEDERDA